MKTKIFVFCRKPNKKNYHFEQILWLRGQFDTTSYFSGFRGSKLPLVLLSNRGETCYNAI